MFLRVKMPDPGKPSANRFVNIRFHIGPDEEFQASAGQIRTTARNAKALAHLFRQAAADEASKARPQFTVVVEYDA